MHNERFWWNVNLTVEAAVAACDQGVDPDEAGREQGGAPVEWALSKWTDLGQAWAIHQALQHWRHTQSRSGEAAKLALWQGVARRGRAVELADQVQGSLPDLPNGVNGILPLMLQAQTNALADLTIPRPIQTLRAILNKPRYQSWASHESLAGVPDGVWGWSMLDRCAANLPASGRASLTTHLRKEWAALPLEDRQAYLEALLAHAVKATQAHEPGQSEGESDPLRRHGALWQSWHTVATQWTGVQIEPEVGLRLFQSGALTEALVQWHPKLFTAYDHHHYHEVRDAMALGLEDALVGPDAQRAWQVATLPLPRLGLALSEPQKTALAQWGKLIHEAGEVVRSHLSAEAYAHLSHFPELHTAFRAHTLAQTPATAPGRRRRRA